MVGWVEDIYFGREEFDQVEETGLGEVVLGQAFWQIDSHGRQLDFVLWGEYFGQLTGASGWDIEDIYFWKVEFDSGVGVPGRLEEDQSFGEASFSQEVEKTGWKRVGMHLGQEVGLAAN